MALIVEDGTGLNNAQCYVDADYLRAYLFDRVKVQDEYTTQQLESALVVAAQDWIDTHEFKSDILVDTQALEWPRKCYDGIPEKIKKANAEAARLHLLDALLVDTSKISESGAVESQSQKLSTLSTSTKFKDGTQQVYGRILPKQLKALIRPFLASSGLGSVVRL